MHLRFLEGQRLGQAKRQVPLGGDAYVAASSGVGRSGRFDRGPNERALVPGAIADDGHIPLLVRSTLDEDAEVCMGTGLPLRDIAVSPRRR